MVSTATRRDYAEKEAYGVTTKSTDFVKANLPKIGSVVQIEGIMSGNTVQDFGNEQWVVFSDEHGNRIAVSGFSWGYRGEGCHGLQKIAQELGFADIDADFIASRRKNEYWIVQRERLQLTKEIAEYIIHLQRFADSEVGLEEWDLDIRHKLELEFPEFRWGRENSEFQSWLWSVRTEQETEVAEARFLMGYHIPFDEVYHAEDPDLPESAYQLYTESSKVAAEIFEETKIHADNQLLAQDKAKQINLHKEWEVSTRNKC